MLHQADKRQYKDPNKADVTPKKKSSNKLSDISKHAREFSRGKVDWDKPETLKTIVEINHLFK